MSWDRYTLSVVAVTGLVFVLPPLGIAVGVYAGRWARNRNARGKQ